MNSFEIQKEISTKLGKINDNQLSLKNTDYVVIRAHEQGLTLSVEFKAQRQGWRDEINTLQAEIAALEEQKAAAEAEEANATHEA